MDILLKKWLLSTVSTALLISACPSVIYAGCIPGRDEGENDVAPNGIGAPSVTASEISTSQTLQFIRKRQDEIQLASNAAPLSAPAAASPAAQPPVAQGGQIVSSAANTADVATPPVARPRGGAKAQPAASGGGNAPSTAMSAPAPEPAYTSKLRDPAFAGAGAVEGSRFAMWGGAFGDIERRDNLPFSGGVTPIKSSQFTTGLITGTDWSMSKYVALPGELRLGIFGGLTQARTKYSDGFYNGATNTGGAPGNCGDPNNDNFEGAGGPGAIHCFFRHDARDISRGASFGGYGLYVSGPWALDLVAKADFNKTRATDRNHECGGDGELHGDIFRQAQQSTIAMTFAGNGSYRMPITSSSWFEPTLGFRYLHLAAATPTSSFPTGADQLVGPLPIGTIDGDALRLQAGVRFGVTRPTPFGQWTGVLTGLVYNEVAVSGFGSSASQSTMQIDEGKFRGLLQLSNTIYAGDGVSYLVQGDVRGGQNLLGYGGKVIVRKEW